MAEIWVLNVALSEIGYHHGTLRSTTFPGSFSMPLCTTSLQKDSVDANGMLTERMKLMNGAPGSDPSTRRTTRPQTTIGRYLSCLDLTPPALVAVWEFTVLRAVLKRLWLRESTLYSRTIDRSQQVRRSSKHSIPLA